MSAGPTRRRSVVEDRHVAVVVLRRRVDDARAAEALAREQHAIAINHARGVDLAGLLVQVWCSLADSLRSGAEGSGECRLLSYAGFLAVGPILPERLRESYFSQASAAATRK